MDWDESVVRKREVLVRWSLLWAFVRAFVVFV